MHPSFLPIIYSKKPYFLSTSCVPGTVLGAGGWGIENPFLEENRESCMDGAISDMFLGVRDAQGEKREKDYLE